jgi:hypothetical protein
MKIALNTPNNQFGSERKKGVSNSLTSSLHREGNSCMSLAQERVGTTGHLGQSTILGAWRPGKHLDKLKEKILQRAYSPS